MVFPLPGIKRTGLSCLLSASFFFAFVSFPALCADWGGPPYYTPLEFFHQEHEYPEFFFHSMLASERAFWDQSFFCFFRSFIRSFDGSCFFVLNCSSFFVFSCFFFLEKHAGVASIALLYVDTRAEKVSDWQVEREGECISQGGFPILTAYVTLSPSTHEGVWSVLFVRCVRRFFFPPPPPSYFCFLCSY